MEVQILTIRIVSDVDMEKNRREFTRHILGYPSEINTSEILECEIRNVEFPGRNSHENCSELGICLCK